VPVLRIKTSVVELAAGGNALGSGGFTPPALGGDRRALDAGDDQEVDAETMITDQVLKDCDALADEITAKWNEEHPEGPISARQLQQHLAAKIAGTPDQAVSDLNEEQGDRLLAVLARLEDGQSVLRVDAGQIRVGRAA
jgi:hypothetical protein